MEEERQQCSNCRYWSPILQEGSPGTLLRTVQGERSDWGSCGVASQQPQLVRVKGFLETKKVFWCAAYEWDPARSAR